MVCGEEKKNTRQRWLGRLSYVYDLKDITRERNFAEGRNLNLEQNSSCVDSFKPTLFDEKFTINIIVIFKKWMIGGSLLIH